MASSSDKNIKILAAFFAAILLSLVSYAYLSERSKVNVIMAGDVMMARRFEEVISDKGYDFLSSRAKKLLQGADIVLVNLESPLTRETKEFAEKKYYFKSAPASAVVLRRLNVSAVTLANNHIMDYGYPGLKETMEVLKKNGIAFFGAGRDIEEARKPAVVEKKGIRIGFLGYSDILPDQFRAKESSPGAAPAVIEYIREDINKLKSGVDIVIVFFHWGKEYEEFPTPRQKELAHECIKSGAEAVFGSHPHVIQGIEKYENKIIAYSLGNFLFDQQLAPTRDSFIFECVFKKTGLIDFFITAIYSSKKDYIPSLAKGERSEKIYSRIKGLSAGLETTVEDRHFRR